ncbi:uncharacterized protein N7511_003220 [Penicillium nucicola]|uniref:uncharacterized protein n=1 Tax=Penicillium nucicola TaxID=1850975 RepID=UPI0025454834|nr:uncharacterized protein N7511_003220 [Penicillium nucicola]KAJ5771169.1 hypothetical protein N7511_003220 [Penicillium nucicola]
MAEIAASAAFATGKEALNTLNNWLDDVEVAKSWYGNNYRKFTGSGKRIGRTLFRLKITGVFTIKKNDWQKVIEECLSDCYNWHRQTEGGECCWLRLFTSMSDDMKRRCLQQSRSSIQSLAVVESMPAARIDLWGLVVFAFANGADQRVRSSSTGSFCANLYAIDFTLTIWQYDMAGPICAHIEPREQGQEDRTMLSSSEWNNLLWSGHTFKECDHILGWPPSADPSADAPGDLITNVLDRELAQIVMDYTWTRILQEKLRKLIYECHDSWDDLKALAGEDQKPRIEVIQRNLKGLKLLLLNDSILPEAIVQEQRKEDTLQYAQKQLEFVGHELSPDGSMKQPRLRGILETRLLPLQQQIVALVRLLTLPKMVIRQLSTRGTGTHVSLA